MKLITNIILFILLALCCKGYSFSSSVTPHELPLQQILDAFQKVGATVHDPALYSGWPAGGGHITTDTCKEICPGKQTQGVCYYAYLDNQINFAPTCDYYYPEGGTSGKLRTNNAVPIATADASRIKEHEEGHVNIFNAFTAIWKSYEEHFNAYVSDCFKSAPEAEAAMKSDMIDAVQQVSVLSSTYAQLWNAIHGALPGTAEDADAWRTPNTKGWETPIVNAINQFHINFKYTTGNCQCE